MKKKFFKKLSFVLALAMMISVIAPAASAFAASGLKLNSTNKYLHLDVEGKDEYNFNFTAGKKKGYQYFWYSTNEKVATVNAKNGVTTAKGAGKTTIICEVTDKDGEYVDTVKATVTVRDNIKEVKISNPVESLQVNEEHDFNRSYVTVAGNTKGSESVTRWTVEPSEGATINDKGVFVATEAGEYTVTARSFQSKAKYNDWKKDPVANAKYVLAEDSVVVKVAPTMIEAKQLTKSTAKVVFGADMSKEVNKSNLKVYSLVNDVRVNQLVKDVKFNAEGTEATVELYVDFASEGNYLFVYEDMEKGFKAAKLNDPAEVDRVEIAFNTMEYLKSPETLTVKLYNKNGVDITSPTLTSRVTYRLEEGSQGYISGNDQLYLFNKDDKAIVTATFHTYTYDEVTFKENVIEGTGVVVAVDAATYELDNTTEWTFGDQGSNPDWSKSLTKTLAAGDLNKKLYARVKKTDGKTYAYSYAGTFDNGEHDNKLTFGSSDDSVLIVYEDGTVYPVKAGNAVIISYYNGVARDAIAVTVQGERKVATFTADKYVVNISNSAYVEATDKIKLTVKDQLNADWPNVSVAVEPLSGNPTTGASPIAIGSHGDEIAINGAGAGEGSWKYLVKGYDRQFMITVNVQAPKRGNDVTDGLEGVVRWDLSLDNYTVDTKVENNKVLKSVTPTLIGYAANGVACYKADFSSNAGRFFYKVNDTVQDSASFAVATAGETISTPAATTSTPAITSVSGTSVDKEAKGAYIVTVYEKVDGNDILRGTRSFEVKDTTPAPTVVREKQVTAETNILKAVRDAFKVSLNGNAIDDTRLYNVTYVVDGVKHTVDTNDDVITAGKTVFVESVKFMETYVQNDVTYAVEYTATINANITVGR